MCFFRLLVHVQDSRAGAAARSALRRLYGVRSGNLPGGAPLPPYIAGTPLPDAALSALGCPGGTWPLRGAADRPDGTRAAGDGEWPWESPRQGPLRMWLGGAGAAWPLHIRGVDVLRYQLMGVTRVVLFPPRDAARLIRPAMSGTGQGGEMLTASSQTQFEVGARAAGSTGATHRRTVRWSQLGVVQYAQLPPLVARWPRLAQCAGVGGLPAGAGGARRAGPGPHPFVDLHPGEVLYVPSGWSSSHKNMGRVGGEDVALAVEVYPYPGSLA